MQINRVESNCNQIKLSNMVFMNIKEVWYLGQFEPTLHVVHFFQVRSKILQKAKNSPKFDRCIKLGRTGTVFV
jgi:hypothetical protein